MDSQDPGTVEDFRQLYELLRRYEGRHLFEEVLRPAIPAAVKLLQGLQRYRKRLPDEAAQHTDSWSFFALSVVNDALRLPLRLSLDEHLRFFESLGFEPFEGGSFNPVRRVSAGDERLLRRLGVRLMGSPSASLTSRSAPARYAQEGACPSYAPHRRRKSQRCEHL